MVAREAVAPVPITGRRVRRRDGYTGRTLQRFTIAGTACGLVVIAYTVPFALSARDGYAQRRIKIELQSLVRENELLRVESARLSSPSRAVAFARANGMVFRQTPQYVTLAKAPPVPFVRRSLLARLTAFSFR